MTQESTNQNRRQSSLIPKKPTLQITIFFHLCASMVFLSGFLLLMTWNFVYSGEADLVQIQLEFANKIVWFISLLFIVLGLVSFIISVTFSARITGPMVAVNRMLDDLMAGNYSKRINLRDGDEFHDIATRLNELASKLEAK